MLQAPEKLSSKVAQAHDDPANTLFVSIGSLWEIQIKSATGKLELDVPLAQIVNEQFEAGRFQMLDIRAAHVLALNELPRHHGDPFDRMMIAQARVEALPLVSVDRVFEQYPVEIFW
jgi:PIN domain nuclease of toxin-antitoxin system